MRKFNKDQIQKIILSGMLFIFLLYCYFTYGLDPLKAKNKRNTTEMEEVQKKLDAAKLQIRKGQNAVTNAATAVATMESIKGMIPREAPIAWLPPRLTAFFASQGIEKIAVKPGRTEPVRLEGLGDFKYYFWSIETEGISFLKMAPALSALENNQPLLIIRGLHFEVLPGNPEMQKFSCELNSILK